MRNSIFKKGITEKDQKLFAVAAKDFDKAINFNSQYTKAYIENGNVNLKCAELTLPGKFYKSLRVGAIQSGSDYSNYLTLYFNNHQFQKAIDLVQKCNSCNDADRIIGMSYYNLEDYAKAESLLKTALSKNSQDAESAYTLGRTYIELEKEKKALPYYQQAITIEPDKSAWIYELGLIYYNQEDYKSALKYFTLAADKGYNKNKRLL